MPAIRIAAPGVAVVLLWVGAGALHAGDVYSSLAASQSAQPGQEPSAAPDSATQPFPPLPERSWPFEQGPTASAVPAAAPAGGSAPGASPSGATEARPLDVVWADYQRAAETPGATRSDVLSAAHAADEPIAGAPHADRAHAAEAEIPLPAAEGPLALKPPGEKPADSLGPFSGWSSITTVGSSLAVVVGLFLAFAWAVRRTTPRGLTALPSEVVETLGRVGLAQRQQLYLLRCGRKLLLVCVTPAGVETLTEITDPDEVAQVTGLCHQAHPASASAAFRQVFQQMAGQRGGLDEYADRASRYYGRTRDSALEDRDV